MTDDNVNKVTKENFESLLFRSQIEWETSMSDSNFSFHDVKLLYYKFYKMNFRLGGSYIVSLDWITKKVTRNPRNKDDRYFQYALTVALSYNGEITWNPERISNINLFINKYNWDKIKLPSKIGEWKICEKKWIKNCP